MMAFPLFIGARLNPHVPAVQGESILQLRARRSFGVQMNALRAFAARQLRQLEKHYRTDMFWRGGTRSIGQTS
jgi:diaminopimelate decarboxylase